LINVFFFLFHYHIYRILSVGKAIMNLIDELCYI
jgi:hypothetical protein